MTNHYKPKKISQITKTDSRVAVIGNVVDIGENSFVLDDGDGKIEIISDKEVEKDKLVRVFCSVVDEKLKADLIQSLNGFDVNLYNKVLELYNRAGV